MLTVRVLGPLGVAVDGHEVDLGGRGRRALLARLAVDEGHVVATDRLLDDLWHGAPPPSATATLQAHVSHLRRALEPDRSPRSPSAVLALRPPGYALHVGEGLDAHRVERWAERARGEDPGRARATLRAALALWTGPSLGEFAGEPWARAEADRLDELRRVLLERLALLELTHGGPDGARSATELLAPHVAEHPLREEPARVLALALEASGRRADAVAGLAALRDRLAAERGLDPSPALVTLEQRLAGNEAPSPAPARPRRSEPPRTHRLPPPDAAALIGREAELARLDRVAERVAAGPGELALVGGEAGSGKTSVLDELARRLRHRGWRVVTGRCPEVDGAPPAWAWTEIAAAVAAVPGAHSPSPTPGDPGAPFRLGRALVDRLGATGATGPTLITLDDLHRADDETQRLLRLVVSAAVPGVLVVATYREDEVGDDLVATFAAVAAATGDRVDLAGLDVDGCAALLARHGVDADALDGGAPGDLGAGVAARTGGNPLFVREVARLIAAVGPGAAGRTVPAGVRDVLRRRLAGLGEPTTAILRHGAVLGRRVDLDDLVELERHLRGPESGDAAEERVLQACEDALRAGLLTEPAGATTVEFGHDLVREVLYEQVPRLRRSRVHAAALEVLAARHPDDPAALARHALAAGPAVDADTVLDHVEAAAHAARRSGSPRVAADLLSAAERLPATAAVDAGRRLALRCALADAAAHAGAAPAALAQRSVALTEAAAMGGTAPLLAAVTSVDAPVSFALHEDGTIDRALVDAAGALLAADPPLPPADRVRVHVTRAFAWHPTDPAQCARDARAAERLVDEHALAAGLRCRALNARFWSELTPERWSGLDDTGRALLTVAEEAGSPGFRTIGHHARFLHATYRHDLPAAAAHAAAALAEAPHGQLPVTLGWSTVFTGVEALMAGRPDDAEAVVEGVYAAMTAQGAPNADPMRLGGLLGIRRLQRRLADLVDDIAAIHARTPELFADPLALTLLAAGRPRAAAAVWTPDRPVRGDWWWLLWTAIRAEVAVGLGDRDVAARCREELRRWSGHLAGLLSGTATFGPVDLLLAEIGDLLGDPPEEGAALRAAAGALCDRLGAPRWPGSVGAPGPAQAPVSAGRVAEEAGDPAAGPTASVP